MDRFLGFLSGWAGFGFGHAVAGEVVSEIGRETETRPERLSRAEAAAFAGGTAILFGGVITVDMILGPWFPISLLMAGLIGFGVVFLTLPRRLAALTLVLYPLLRLGVQSLLVSQGWAEPDFFWLGTVILYLPMCVGAFFAQAVRRLCYVMSP